MIIRTYMDRDHDFKVFYADTGLEGSSFDSARFMEVQEILKQETPFFPGALSDLLKYPMELDPEVIRKTMLSFGTGKDILPEIKAVGGKIFVSLTVKSPCLYSAIYDYFKTHREDDDAMIFPFCMQKYEQLLVASAYDYLTAFAKNYEGFRFTYLMPEDCFFRVMHLDEVNGAEDEE